MKNVHCSDGIPSLKINLLGADMVMHQSYLLELFAMHCSVQGLFSAAESVSWLQNSVFVNSLACNFIWSHHEMVSNSALFSLTYPVIAASTEFQNILGEILSHFDQVLYQGHLFCSRVGPMTARLFAK